MAPPHFKVRRHPDVEGFLVSLSRVAQHQIERDIEKLEIKGTAAREPLVKHIKGPIWELRSKVRGDGLYRTFYYQDGERSFFAFHAYQKGGKKLPRHIRSAVFAKYTELMGEKP